MEPITTILGIAGSLRRASYNRAALRAAQPLVPEGATLEIFELDGSRASTRTTKPTRRQRLWS
jgi:NAD(P)H-dependent FMN reductase